MLSAGTGDDGKTYLRDGSRVDKADSRVEAYGIVDEFNSYLGIVLSQDIAPITKDVLSKVQNHLFILGSDLSTPAEHDQAKLDSDESFKPVRIEKKHVEFLSENVEKIGDSLEPLTKFILPAGNLTSAYLHVARTMVRKVERRVVELAKNTTINPKIIPYLNRLSDILFLLARYENKRQGIPDTPVDFEA